MKNCLTLLGIVCLLLAIVGPAQAADGPKSLAVLSLSSHDSIQMDPGEMSEVAAASELPTWLSSMLKLFAEGRDAQGLDASRPWGAVLQMGDGLSAFGFVPITDAEELSWELYSFIESTTEVGGGIYKVVGTEPGKELYAKDSGNWLFVSDSAETLANVPADPTRLLGGLNKQYDVAIRMDLKHVPKAEGDKILAMLDKTVGPVLRKHTSDATVEMMGELAEVLDHAVLGWGATVQRTEAEDRPHRATGGGGILPPWKLLWQLEATTAVTDHLATRHSWEGEAPAEPNACTSIRLGGSLALPIVTKPTRTARLQRIPD